MTPASGFDPQVFAAETAGFFDLGPDEVGDVIAHWRDVGRQVAGDADVVLTGPFQRHYTALGTGVPPNFALVLTSEVAIAYRFDPAQIQHPILTGPGQFKGEKARWPLASLRASGVETGRMAWGVRIEVEGGKALPCRTPRLPRNPAAAAVISVLGGELPVGSAPGKE